MDASVRSAPDARGKDLLMARNTHSLVEAPPLSEQLYDRLRNSILRGELRPGDRLSPTRISEEFGVSTMPIREALRGLERDGLVEMSARRPTRVAQPDVGLANEIYPVVELLETHAIRTATKAPAAALEAARRANDRMRAATASGDPLACISADVEFHEAILGISDNGTLRRTITDLKVRLQLLEASYYRLEGAEQSVRDHAAIVDALERRDFQLAADTLALNWGRTLGVLRSALVRRDD
jgi:DNA-binding GntR family transcriptional regulator